MKKFFFTFIFIFLMAFAAIGENYEERYRYPRPWSCEGVDAAIVDYEELFYAKGRITGTCHSLDGHKTVVSVKDGRLHGERIDYDHDGNIVMISKYKNGVKDGYLRVFLPNGQVNELIFSNNEFVGRNHYNDIAELPSE